MNPSMTAQTSSALVSWSGGKDSCLALWRARQSGMQISRLITALDEGGQRARSHGVPPDLLQAQADALGVPQAFYSTSWQQYEENSLPPCAPPTATACATQGSAISTCRRIASGKKKSARKPACKLAGLPLWLQLRRQLVDEFLALGFKAVMLCINGNHLPQEFCGREFDVVFLADLFAPQHQYFRSAVGTNAQPSYAVFLLTAFSSRILGCNVSK